MGIKTIKKLRLAVVGCGLIGKEHISRIQRSARAQLCATVDPKLTDNSPLVRTSCAHFESLERLFAEVKPDGVILATPNALHFSQAKYCLEAGIGVLVEKPMTDNLEDAAKLTELVEAERGHLLVGHHRAHSPIMACATDVIKRGVLGKLVAIQGSALFYKPDHYFDAAPWRVQKGGGPILINLIHEIGNLRQLCGEIEEVHALSSNAIRGHPVEDTAAVLFRFESGALGTFILSDTASASRSWEQTTGENPAYPSYPDEDCYYVAGTQGSLSLPTMRLKRFVNAQEPSWWTELTSSVLEYRREDPLEIQLEHFCDLIEGKCSPRVSAFDGMQNLKVIDAIQRSIELGEKVAIG